MSHSSTFSVSPLRGLVRYLFSYLGLTPQAITCRRSAAKDRSGNNCPVFRGVSFQLAIMRVRKLEAYATYFSNDPKDVGKEKLGEMDLQRI